MPSAYIAIEDGNVIEGRCRSPGRGRGELVFTTAYTGYEESLTDPSYAANVLTFAYPLIGNYGVREERFESDTVHPHAAIAREMTEEVARWLREENVPAVDHVDTRDIVLDIREGGAKRCGIAAGDDATPEQAREELEACPKMGERTNIGSHVGVKEPTVYGAENTGVDVALIDCGAKGSIIDSLLARGVTLHRLPHDSTPKDVEEVDPDVLFLSNGPGDPTVFTEAERVVEEFIGTIPIAGICLGQQIVANAIGGETTKMDFGHRGVNQPVKDVRTDRVVMTTQNHGYTVDSPGDLEVTQVNVNDGTVEGLENDELDILTRQYHPEANPGPHDSLDFFDDVIRLAQG